MPLSSGSIILANASLLWLFRPGGVMELYGRMEPTVWGEVTSFVTDMHMWWT